MPQTFRQFWSYKIFRYWLVITLGWIAAGGAMFFDDKGIPSIWKGCEELRGMVMVDTGEPVSEARIAQCEAEWRDVRNGRLFRLTWPILAFPLVLGVIWLQGRQREGTVG